MNYVEIISILVTVGGGVLASYLKIKEQIAQVQNQANVSAAILDQAIKQIHGLQVDINTVQRDIHNIALIIGTDRAIAEQKKRELNE